MIDANALVEACQKACQEWAPPLATKEVLERLVGDQATKEPFGPVEEGGLTTIHHSALLTILHVVWAPYMFLYPHDHRMWAVIGVYHGQEDNTFYRRSQKGSGLEVVNGRSLCEREALVLGDEVIHSVNNPTSVYTAAIHVYGGDFFATPRSSWESDDAPERPYNVDWTTRAFAEANERARRSLRK